MFNKKLFLSTLILKNITIEEFAKIIGVSKTTLYRKINGISDFYREEIQKAKTVFTKDEIDSIFFAEKVA